MTSTNQTSLILLSLDKAFIDNRDNLSEQDRKSLLDAGVNTIKLKPVAKTKRKGAARNGNSKTRN